MKKTLNLSILCCLFFGQLAVYGQNKSTAKFGKIMPADFNISAQPFDSSADAVVIADIGSSGFVGNNKGRFSLEFRRFKRMKILNKSGYEAAKVIISLYSSGEDVEKLEGLKAVTYNLENGQVVQTKLDDKSIFTEQASKHIVHKKFTFPAVKEGSIIEYSYIQSSDFIFNLQPWAFQGEYPCFWSEYTVDIPRFYDYVILSQGYEPFSINKRESSRNNFHVMIPGGAEKDEGISFDDDVVSHHWVMKNVPALKDESFTTTLQNHIAKIEFQLNAIQYPDQPVKTVMPNWVSVSEEMLKDDNFGADIRRNNGWLDDELKNITRGASSPLEKAKKIYAYVRDNFTCTDHSGQESDQPIKTVFKNKSGNVAGLNLLLDAMLNHENIDADPVILSTRDHGYTHEIYPLLYRFNYVICRIRIDSSVYYLDASHPWMGFGHIPGYCYNGQARVVNKELPAAVYFNAGDLTEGKTTMVLISDDGKGGLEGSCQSMPGYFESSDVREKVHKKGEKAFFSDIQSAYMGGMAISDGAIDSLKLPEEPVKISYTIKFRPDSTEDILYFTPLVPTETYKANPFKAADRKYPVEMPYAIDETYVLNMDIPAGYTIEEIPKSAKVLFNTDQGFFEYLIQKDSTSIQFRSRLKLLQADYKPEDYAVLRDFFGFIVKKEGEQIVFKKKK
jgi:Domain of Unknown Function with PDB structure (DUF3857)/Transglutaminase-like superfamily/Domain of Unknown Function with PDB structure (DUF3858)